MEDKKELKKKLSKQKFQTVREQAHLLRWLDGRIGVKNNKVYSFLTEFKNNKIHMSEIEITPEIFANTSKSIKILSKFYELTHKLFGKDFLNRKISRYEEIKKFLNASILKNGFESLDFETLLLITPYLHPPPTTIYKKIKNGELPEIDFENLPAKSKKLYFYIEGCLGIVRENSRENTYGRRFSFVKDPVLLIEMAKYMDNKTIEELAKILKGKNEFIHHLLWEIIYKDFSEEKLKYVIKNNKILNKVKELSIWIPFIKNVKIIKRILEINSFEEEKIEEFIEEIPFGKLINSAEEESILKILQIYNRDELIEGIKGIKGYWWRYIPDFNPFKSIVFTKTEKLITSFENRKKFKLYAFAFHNLKDFNHFINFWQKNKSNLFEKLYNVDIFWLYKEFEYNKIEEIFEGFINVYSGIDSNYRHSLHLLPFLSLCKDKYFLRSNYTNLPMIKEKILYMSDRILEIQKENKILEFIFVNFDKIANKFLSENYGYSTYDLALSSYLCYLLSLTSPEFFTECFFEVINIYKEEINKIEKEEAKEIIRITKSNIPLKFYELLQNSFIKSPRKTMRIFIDLLKVYKYVDTVEKIKKFMKDFQEKIEFKVKEKEEFEKELNYLKKLKRKDGKIIKRIENLEKIIKSYKEYKQKIIEKEKRKFREKISYKFIKEFENFVNNIYLEILYDLPPIKGKIEIKEDLRTAIYFYLNLEKNKRKTKEVIYHIIKGDYRKWLLNLKENKEFIEKLKRKGINVEPLINGFSLKVNDFLLYIETDPLKILMMGTLFDTCLSVKGDYNYAVVPYIVDINKKVIYMKDKRNKIVARARLDISDKGYMKMMRIYSNTKIEKIGVYFKEFLDKFSAVTGIKRGNEGNFKSLHNLEEGQLEYKIRKEKIKEEKFEIENLRKLDMKKIYNLFTDIYYDENDENKTKFLENVDKILNSILKYQQPFTDIKIVFSILHTMSDDFLEEEYLPWEESFKEKFNKTYLKSFQVLINMNLKDVPIKEVIKNNFYGYFLIPYFKASKYAKKAKMKFYEEVANFPIKFTFLILENLNEELLDYMEGLIEEEKVEDFLPHIGSKGKEEFYKIFHHFLDKLALNLKNKKISKEEFFQFLKGYYLMYKFQFREWCPACSEGVIERLKKIYSKTIEKREIGIKDKKFIQIIGDKILR